MRLTSQSWIGDRPPIVVNGRYRVHHITGIQRYAHEIASRMPDDLEIVQPERAKGPIGHLWEQTILPTACHGRLLWNPSPSGPILYPRHVVTVHDLFVMEHPEWYSSTYARWQSFQLAQLTRKAVHIIAVSHYTKSRLVSVLGLDPCRITVIQNGLTSGCSRTGQDAIDAAHAALHLPSRRYVLTLSSLETRKNLRTVLHAWSIALKNLPDDVWLVLAGSSADRKVYADHALDTNAPRIFFTGYVPDEHLAGLYSGASLFLFPSLAEGFGIPVLEAMACGVRVITSANSSLSEVGGDLATYVDPMDAIQIAHLVVKMLKDGAHPDNPFEPAILRANTFSWTEAARKTQSTLKQAASPHAKGSFVEGQEAI
jgi:glycosyltransferase involved in cell wall biosynthesis